MFGKITDKLRRIFGITSEQPAAKPTVGKKKKTRNLLQISIPEFTMFRQRRKRKRKKHLRELAFL